MKILVFCQRKKSLDKKDKDKVDIIVNKLEHFVRDNYISNEYIFEYLTDGLNDFSLYEADYKMFFDVLNKDNNIKETSIKFMIEHFEYYDMIIMQTCPLILVKKQIPYLFNCLKTDGIVLFTNFCDYIELGYSNILNEDKINSAISCIVKECLIKTDKKYNEYKKINNYYK